MAFGRLLKSRFPKTQQAIDDFLLEILTEEKPMIDYTKMDAALFAIEGFISRLITHKDNLDHADYYLSMVRNLRGTISTERFDRVIQPVKKLDSHLADMEDRIKKTPRLKQKRASDKGIMSFKQRNQISTKMKKYWVKRSAADKKKGKRNV